MARQAEMKQQSFVFGSAVLDAFHQLTGQPIRLSRAAPTRKNEGDLTGPLMRFTWTFYELLRVRCSAEPELAGLVAQKALNPKAETIADWCRRYRRAG